MSVRVVLDQGPSNLYTNLDVISGKVQLALNREESFSAVTIKLECESRTRLAGPRRGTKNERYESELEVHKLLYKTETVFPSAQMIGLAQGQRASFTLPAGNHQWPFRYKIPFNNACAPVNSLMDKLQMNQEFTQHIKRPLPPTLTGFPGMCEIRYYVKVTCARSSLFKENYRTEEPFLFMPIEPIRPPMNRRESYARRQHQFAPRRQQSISGGGNLFKKQAKGPVEAGVPPIISLDGRLPDPAIVTCNRPLPLRVIIKKLNESAEPIYMTVFQILLIAHTRIKAHELQRTENSSFVIVSKANFSTLLADASTPTGKEMEIDPGMWAQVPLPNMVCPNFETCNVSRWYELKINIGLVYGPTAASGAPRPELTIQELHMPCKIFSGIEPPAALIEELFKRQSQPQAPPRITHPPGAFTDTVPHETVASSGPPLDPNAPLPAYSPPAPGAMVAGQAQAAPRPPAGGDVPDAPPPSYEDAMADDLAPVDGPRTQYEQPQTAPLVGGDEKRSMFGR